MRFTKIFKATECNKQDLDLATSLILTWATLYLVVDFLILGNMNLNVIAICVLICLYRISIDVIKTITKSKISTNFPLSFEFCLKDSTQYKRHETNLKNEIIEPVFYCIPQELKSDYQELIVPANTEISLVDIIDIKNSTTKAKILQEINVLIPNGHYAYHNPSNKYILGHSISNSAAFFVLPQGIKLQIGSISLLTTMEQTFHFMKSTSFIQPEGIEISIGEINAITKNKCECNIMFPEFI